MMKQSGGRNIELRADVTDDHAARVGGEKQAHDAQTRLRTHGRKHIGVARDAGVAGCLVRDANV